MTVILKVSKVDGVVEYEEVELSILLDLFVFGWR